jgi:AcrR family transcriptional regulator
MVVQQDSGEARHQRADAARNRERLLAAAADVFRERGLGGGVGEIAERAGVGRATLFRNFPTKQALMVALLAHEMRQAIAQGRQTLAEADDHGVLMQYAERVIALQQENRGLLQAVAWDAYMEDPEIAATHADLMALLDEMIAHDQQLGLIRNGISASDVMMLMKGVFAVACSPLGGDAAAVERHLQLVGQAIATARDGSR